MNNQTITFTSDFGEDFAKGQVEAVIQTLNPNARFITCTNQVAPFSIIEGAFVLLHFFGFTPENSIHLAIVDPGVGSKRKGLIIKTKNHFFIGPDNGLLFPAANKDAIQKTYYIDEIKLTGSFSSTFHGRDVFAKAAALISNGVLPETFAQEIDKNRIIKLVLQKNQILHIDSYGNIKINASCKNLKPGDLLNIITSRVNIPVRFVRIFSDVEKGEYLAYEGSHQTLEIARNLESANEELDLIVGDIIGIEKVSKE